MLNFLCLYPWSILLNGFFFSCSFCLVMESEISHRKWQETFSSFIFSRQDYRRRQWHPTPVLLPGKIPWMGGPGGLLSMGSHRVGHDWVTSLSLFTFMHYGRKWQPTPVFLPGESQGWGSLVGCRLWGRTESDMTEGT